jgi:hypothetical protein
MAILSTASGAQSAAQYGWEQLKLQQAQRNADQAQQTAQSLLVQAQDAQRTADRAQDNARSLSVQAEQAQTNAGQAAQGLAAIKTVDQMQSQLITVVDQVVQRQQKSLPTPPQQPSTPVVNTQGQTTGRVINTTA